jgi:hypothetical protein
MSWSRIYQMHEKYLWSIFSAMFGFCLCLIFINCQLKSCDMAETDSNLDTTIRREEIRSKIRIIRESELMIICFKSLFLLTGERIITTELLRTRILCMVLLRPNGILQILISHTVCTRSLVRIFFGNSKYSK